MRTLIHNAHIVNENRQFDASVVIEDELIADITEGNDNIDTNAFDYVIDAYQDREVRPNQIWAASLPYSPLDRKQQKAVVDICTKELLTPRGLRTISPKSGNYRPIYIGGQLERDRNFHNGPVWPFTIAAYADAYMRVYKMSGVGFIRRALVGFEQEMSELCIGTLNEIYDGNPPYKGHGAMSYAPSVAAVISMCNTVRDYEAREAQQQLITEKEQ